MKKDNTKKSIYHGVKEIARRANVSIATVDRVLNNRPGVSPTTKRKIERIIKEINYKPNIIASRLASRKVLRFGVLIPMVSEDTNFWEAPLNGVRRAEKGLKELGIEVEIHLFDLNEKKTFEEQGNEILKNNPDGVLLAPSFIGEARQFVSQCQTRKIPYVLMDSNIPHQEGLCYIGPHLFRSGFLGGQLINFIMKSSGNILIINIASELESHNDLAEIEEGFRAYFRYHNVYHNIFEISITLTDYPSIEDAICRAFKENWEIKAVFVTNSRVASVARYLEKINRSDIFLIGYDFLLENIEYLKKEIIDILICHKPEEQAYRGIMTLYRHLVLGESIESLHFMPIDIITKENYEFYHD